MSDDKSNEDQGKLDAFLEGIRGRFDDGLSELDAAFGQFYLDIIAVEVNIWENFWRSFTGLDLLDLGNRFERLAIDTLDGTLLAFADLIQRISAIPLRIVTRELIQDFFPTPKWMSQRVIRMDDAMKLVATEMVEQALDFGVNLNYPDPLLEKAKTAVLWERIRAFWDTQDTKWMGKIIKSALKGKIVRLLAIVVKIVVGVAVVAMVWWFAEKVNTKETDLRLSKKPLTNKNPFVVRKQKHRVRDNPKLPNR